MLAQLFALCTVIAAVVDATTWTLATDPSRGGGVFLWSEQSTWAVASTGKGETGAGFPAQEGYLECWGMDLGCY
jgi:hypothetical protein